MLDLDTGEREAQVQEPARFTLSTTAIEVLCLLLSALVLIWSPPLIRTRRGVAILMGAFAQSRWLCFGCGSFPRTHAERA